MSHVGTWMQRLSQSWLVLSLSDNPALALGLLTTCQLLPVFVAAPIGGTIADRFDRKSAMIASQLLCALVSGAIAITALTGAMTFPLLCLFGLLFGFCSSLDSPIRQSVVNDLVEADEVPSAVGLDASVSAASRMVGPAIAGLLIAAVGAGITIGLNAISFLFVVATLATVKLSARSTSASRTREPSTWGEVKQTLSRRPDLTFAIIAAGLVGALAVNYPTFYTLIVSDIFDRDSSGLGIVVSATGAGSVLGGLVIAARSVLRVRVVAACAVIYPAVMAASALSGSFWAYVIFNVAVGASLSLATTSAMSYLQVRVPDQVRGRTLALASVSSSGLGPLAALPVGALVSWLGPLNAILVSGSVVSVLALALAGRFVVTEGLLVRPQVSAAKVRVLPQPVTAREAQAA